MPDGLVTYEMTMRFYQLDPIQDPRWADLADRHPGASVFHSVGWLKTLRSTYGYEPVAFTTSPPKAELKNGLVFCHVDSWLTGHRLVSLPFSDHCEPLFDSAEDANFLVQCLLATMERKEWEYLEVRPVDTNFGQAANQMGFAPAARYFIHMLDLCPNLEDVFRNLDKDSVQRRVRRAQQAGLVEACGNSENLLQEFYRLFVITRGRHNVPPPPYAWFQNLTRCLDKGVVIRVAYQGETPIAAVLTLCFRGIAYYKYGCSNVHFKNLGAMPWLLWNAIAAAKSSGAREFDMGRTEEANAGLLAFKNHWVPEPKRLVYWRYPATSLSLDSADGWKLRMAKHAFSYMPSGLLTITGKLLYRHIG